jgi:DNA helicase IV
VTDWRAPASEPFYRATPTEPFGVVRRRHIMCKGQKVVHLEDELLDAEHTTDGEMVLVGEAALLDALRRSRSGRMRDIVATIQREQDEIIRAPLEGTLIVQGGPGTGKTAVALHRAAYLLYTHRERLTRTGVLVIGPNAVFLRYIEQVLPSLGEAATLGSIDELVHGVRATIHDRPEVARIKGDARMANVIERAVNGLRRGLERPTTIRYEGADLQLSVRASRHIVKLIHKRTRGSHNEKRPDVRGLLMQFLWDRWKKKQRQFSALYGEEARASFEQELSENDAFNAALDAMWPLMSATDLVRSLTSDQARLAHAAKDVLSTKDQETLLHGPREGLSEADVALIDEAAPLLGPTHVRRRRRPKIDPEERFHIERLVDELEQLNPIIKSERRAFIDRLVAQRLELEAEGEEYKRPPREWFGHVVIDEAQSLSPMQWRMIGRRCPSRSMTIVGDLGQTMGAWATGRWEDVLAQLAPPTSQIAQLSINYRSPAPVAEIAAQVLAEAAPDLEVPRAVRTDGDVPRFINVPPADLVVRATEAGQQAAAEMEAETEKGTVAVIAPASVVGEVRTSLGISPEASGPSLLDVPVSALTVDDSRGLEFDTVVVVEPAAIVEQSGLRALYIALTRPTRSLVIVHADPLPASMRSVTRS